MPSVSIITPFHNGFDLLKDYDAATTGAQLVIIDNASDKETADALASLPPERGVLIRNETNVGFAAANNQGYARATGDIIVFLNSDIAGDPAWLAMVLQDVKDGALYGPSLQQQLVAGRWLPYLEGWCIAATRATWRELYECFTVPDVLGRGFGPWDAAAYPGPYWEDNDLCFRALQAGIALVQTQWPIQHKGGRSSKSLASNAASLEANRLTFARRAQAALSDGPGVATPTYPAYLQQLFTQSDIQHHLPLLYSLARGNVVELGTRSGVSTTALLAGVETRGGHVWSVDTDDCSKVAEGNEHWTFIQSDSRNPELPGMIAVIDLLLIDTEHRVEVTAAELKLWAPFMRPGGTICLHDTETFPGVRRAVNEFCERVGWPATFVLPCHGMAVIEVPPTKDMPEDEQVSLEGAAWAMEGAKL